LFFIASICVLGWLILKVEKIDFFGRKPMRSFVAIFDQAAGLPKQSKVRIAGVEVGRVLEIKLTPNGRALVTFTVEETVSVYANATANLANIGILGEKYISLDPGQAETGLAETGIQLTSRMSAGLDAIMESIGAMATDLSGITHALNASFGGEHGRIKMDEIIYNVQVLTAELRAAAQENHIVLNRAMTNIEAITRDFREQLPMIAKQFDDLGARLNALVDENRPEIKGITSEVRKLALGFQDTSDNLRDIIGGMKRGEGTIGKLLTDETTLEKLNAGIDNLNEMLVGFKNMEMLLDMGATSWPERGGGRVGIGITLASKKDYWYSIDLASAPDGKVKDETFNIVKIDPATGQQVEVPTTFRTVSSQQTFTASAQFNKRIGNNLVVHAGIIDGFGGGGAEFRAFEDRFRLGALAYDFNKREGKENPRLRLTTTYELWKGIYAQAGMQDIANKDTRTIFFGGGVRWKDDDLKKLVGLAGVAK
jgi:phospholipid/cholesterol/gamma-HCH transport system substrate-binding protein